MINRRDQDIINELVALCKDLQQDIMGHLTYYRASVYKSETQDQINGRLWELELFVKLFDDDDLDDCFDDFKVSATSGNIRIPQGECLLTWRISSLFKELNSRLTELIEMREQSNTQHEIVRRTRQHKLSLISICKFGNRNREFFESL